MPAAMPGAVRVGAPASYAQRGSYVTAVRAGERAGFDRVVFQFSGKVPVYTAERVSAIYNGPGATGSRSRGSRSCASPSTGPAPSVRYRRTGPTPAWARSHLRACGLLTRWFWGAVCRLG